jgi:hypothetical protein
MSCEKVGFKESGNRRGKVSQPFYKKNLVHDKKGCDTMGERIGRIGRIQTDFFWYQCTNFKQKNQKKSVSIRPIRPIRSPIVSQNDPTRSITKKRSNGFVLFDLLYFENGFSKFRFERVLKRTFCEVAEFAQYEIR